MRLRDLHVATALGEIFDISCSFWLAEFPHVRCYLRPFRVLFAL
jgi:hypothetical protein